MTEFIEGEDPEDRAPLCSECGRDIERREESMWIEKKYCRPQLHGRPWFYDLDKSQVLVCRQCFKNDAD